MITDCDPFTRNFLIKMGVRVNPPASAPADPYTTLRQEVSTTCLNRTINTHFNIIMFLSPHTDGGEHEATAAV